MTDLPVRKLRNDVSEVLRKVEAGESFQVTVHGRPVATLAPINRRRGSMSWERFIEGPRADADLGRELRAEFGAETTDDLKDPWERES